MSELPPGAPVPPPEREPVTYDQVLDSVRALKAAGLRDPRKSRTAGVQEVDDLITDWKSSKGLHMAGIHTIEKASDIVRSALLWVEAGYDSLRYLRDAMEQLEDEYKMALPEGNEGILQLLKSALDALEERVGQENAFEKMPAKLAGKIREAQKQAADGLPQHSVGILTMALVDARFKRLPPEMLDRVRSLRDGYKAAMDAAKKTQ